MNNNNKKFEKKTEKKEYSIECNDLPYLLCSRRL